MSSLGGRVKEIRKDFKMTQKDFSKKLESSPSHISGIESDTVPISDRLLKLMCMQFNVNEDWLKYGEGDKHIQTKMIDSATSKLDMIDGIELLNDKIKELSQLLKVIPNEEVTQISYCLSNIINILQNNDLDGNLRFEYLNALENLFSDLDRCIQSFSYTTNISYEKSIDDKGKDIDNIINKYLKPFTRAFEQLGEVYLQKYIAGYESLKDELTAASDFNLNEFKNRKSVPRIKRPIQDAEYVSMTYNDEDKVPILYSNNTENSWVVNQSRGRVNRPPIIFLPQGGGKTEYYLTMLNDLMNKDKVNKHVNMIAEEAASYVPNLGKVAAGPPIDLIEDNSGLSPVFGVKDVDFTLQINGDSMEPDLPNGSYVFVKKQEVLENGEIGIIMINDQVVCKKFYRMNGHVELRSINKKYKPIMLESGDVRILGKVIKN